MFYYKTSIHFIQVFKFFNFELFLNCRAFFKPDILTKRYEKTLCRWLWNANLTLHFLTTNFKEISFTFLSHNDTRHLLQQKDITIIWHFLASGFYWPTKVSFDIKKSNVHCIAFFEELTLANRNLRLKIVSNRNIGCKNR